MNEAIKLAIEQILSRDYNQLVRESAVVDILAMIEKEKVNEFRDGYNKALKDFQVPNEFGQHGI